MALADATQFEIYVLHGAREGKRYILHFYHIQNKKCINCIFSDSGQCRTLLQCGFTLIAVSVLSLFVVIPVLGRQVTLAAHWTRQLSSVPDSYVHLESISFLSLPSIFWVVHGENNSILPLSKDIVGMKEGTLIKYSKLCKNKSAMRA